MKTLVLFLLALFAVAASAQTSDMKLCTTVLMDAAPYADGCLIYHGLEADDISVINKKLDRVTAATINAKDAKGPFTVILDGSITDASGKVVASTPLKISGLELRDVARIMRAEHKAGDELIKLAEDAAGKGHKKAWKGKDK